MLQNVVEGGITVDEDQTRYQIYMCEVSPVYREGVLPGEARVLSTPRGVED